MAISPVLPALLHYLNASPAAGKSESEQHESTDLVEMQKYPMDFIEWACVYFRDPATLAQSPHRWEQGLLFLLPLFNQAFPSPYPASSQATDTMPD